MKEHPETLKIDEVTYVRSDSVPKPPAGKRAVVVVDRGWIFAGDVERKDGRIKLTRVVWVFNWSSIGFDGVIKNPKASQVNLRKLDHDVEIPADCEIFCVPVDDSWGL